jgi:uncharacterized integral membrane protein
MNLKQTLKTLFTIAVLSLLVVMGMYNTQPTELTFPKFKGLRLPAAIMYFAFFGVGVLVGTILMVGGGGKKKGKD